MKIQVVFDNPHSGHNVFWEYTARRVDSTIEGAMEYCNTHDWIPVEMGPEKFNLRTNKIIMIREYV